MTPVERQSIFMLSSILSLRMFGLFAALPVLALYASQMKGATPALVGMALGVYGLTQALCQVPLGAWSDRIGRKQVMTFGLLIFIAGSILTAVSTSILALVIGRALQGAGAIGSTTMALLADLTGEAHRTKAMAITGMTIGLSFTLALMIGPTLIPHTGVHGIFWLAAVMGAVGLLILHTKVPAIHRREQHPSLSQKGALREMLTFSGLPPLYTGIFILHAIFTATFVILPISLQHWAGLEANRQWILYLPVLVIAFILSIVIITVAEKKQRPHFFFLVAIVLTGVGEALLWMMPGNLLLSGGGLLLFFTGFSTLEAFIPSRVSRIAPQSRRGAALGIHSSAQFAGIFFGGLSGGWLYGHYGFSAVYIFCILLVSLWALMTYRIKADSRTIAPLHTIQL